MEGPIESNDVMKPSSSEPLEFSGLNDDEIKRIASVIDRDFKLRKKEHKRMEELKKIIQEENERIENLTVSKEFHNEQCIRCSKPFRIFFNPKEICSKCKLNVCHDCATYNKPTKIWICKLCLKLKELESLTNDWFYLETSKKYKRCGSAKIVRELHKRNKKRSQTDEDVGYGTLHKRPSSDSGDSVSVLSYVVHDKNLQHELDEYSKRLFFLIDNLQSDLSNEDKVYLSTEDFNDHQQLIASEISRARMALTGPIRCSNNKLNKSYEIDLQNLIVQKTEEILHINLQEFSKTEITSSFDDKLAQIIVNNYVKRKIPRKLEQQSTVALPRNSFSSPTWEMKSRNDSVRKMDLSKTPEIVNEEEEEEEEKDGNKTPTNSSTDDQSRRFIDTDLETIQKSTERVDDWKTNFTTSESEIVPSDNDEEEEFSTWL